MILKYKSTKDFLYLPLSASKYLINSEGVVKTAAGEIVEKHTKTNGRSVFKLDWLDGKKQYPLERLLLHVFKPLHIPYNRWSDVGVVFLDDDPLNYSLDNLIWKMPIAMTLTNDDTYAYIPGATRYAISRDGAIRNLVSNKVVRVKDWSGKKYKTAQIRTDDDVFRSSMVHRLVATAWLGIPVDYKDLLVNHKDGIKDNCHVDNLEWVTYSGNLHHAYITDLRTQNHKVLVRNVKTNVVALYHSLAEADRELRTCQASTYHRVRGKGQPVFKGYLQYKYLDDPTPWREVADPDKELVGSIATDARNLLTGEVASYSSKTAAVKACGHSTGSILYRESIGLDMTSDGYQFKPSDSDVDWVEISDVAKAIQDSKDHEAKLSLCILAYSVESGEVITHNGKHDAGKYHGLSIYILKNYLTSDQLITPDKHLLKWNDDETPWRVVKDADVEVIANKYNMKAMNIFTREIRYFKSLQICSDELQVPLHLIVGCLAPGCRKKMVYGWEYKDIKDSSDWGEYSDDAKKIAELSIESQIAPMGHSYKVEDTTTNAVRYHLTVMDAADSLNVNRATIHTNAVNDALVSGIHRVSKI